MVYCPSSTVQRIGGSGWETNPPRPATRPAAGVEDQEAHRDLTTPTCKDNREGAVLQVGIIKSGVTGSFGKLIMIGVREKGDADGKEQAGRE